MAAIAPSKKESLENLGESILQFGVKYNITDRKQLLKEEFLEKNWGEIRAIFVEGREEVLLIDRKIDLYIDSNPIIEKIKRTWKEMFRLFDCETDCRDAFLARFCELFCYSVIYNQQTAKENIPTDEFFAEYRAVFQSIDLQQDEEALYFYLISHLEPIARFGEKMDKLFVDKAMSTLWMPWRTMMGSMEVEPFDKEVFIKTYKEVDQRIQSYCVEHTDVAVLC